MYIPSIGRGRNILRAIKDTADGTIFDTRETNSEVLFKVNDSDLDKIISYLKPQISGADISPFSPKNLKKKKDVLTHAQIEAYRRITGCIPWEDKLLIKQINNLFLNEVVCKKSRCGTDCSKKAIKEIKADMKKEQVSLRDYFFLMGFGDEYLKFLQREVENKYMKGGR
ncbi:MAG: hypothetical protein LUH21_04745 [Clostridiales bacterium]|nr:hypothetical protein [Clostridiales bacterium]